MHTGPETPVKPPLPEFPAAIAAAFLIMAAICWVAPITDRYLLAGILAAIGGTAAIAAIATCRSNQHPVSSTGTSDHH